MNNSMAIKDSRMSVALYLIAGLALTGGLILTIISLMELCTSACVEGHKYRLFHLKFEHFGLVFFGVSILLHLISWKVPLFTTLNGYVIAGAVGGELSFIYLQKYIIGHWCPVCLGIATTVFIAALAYVFNAMIKAKQIDDKKTKGALMKHSAFSILTIIIGFAVALFGVTKVDPLEAKQESLKESIAFGSPTSPIEVYVFTDWFCPACHEVEPELKKLTSSAERNAKVFFIDANIHDESMNFSPYNLSFMIYNKPQYFDLRNALHNLSSTTKAPTDDVIQQKINPYGVTHKDLNYRDIALATKMFAKLKQQFKVTSTPTIVVINVDTKKGKRITGKSDITESNISKAIYDLR
ncbi:MAG: thioredoxin domain-containing protein [Chlamydiota bacterium]